MDDSAKLAALGLPLARTVYGWLGLDRRGNWLIKGERISNPRIADYLGRHYICDDSGRWYVENGLQQVFVALEYTPFVLRVAGLAGKFPRLVTHDGRPVITVRGAWLDETGSLVLQTEHGAGVIDDRDLERVLPCFRGPGQSMLDEDALASAIERLQIEREDAALLFRYHGRAVPMAPIASNAIPARFGFVREPGGA